MRIVLYCCAFFLLGLGMAGADPLQATDPAVVLRDPRPTDSHEFARSMANGGVADVGRKASAAPAHSDCNAANPCALPTPRQTHVDTPPPARPG